MGTFLLLFDFALCDGGGGAAKTVLLLITPMNAAHNCMGHLFHNNCILFQSLQCWC